MCSMRLCRCGGYCSCWPHPLKISVWSVIIIVIVILTMDFLSPSMHKLITTEVCLTKQRTIAKEIKKAIQMGEFFIFSRVETIHMQPLPCRSEPDFLY